jgi:hypothetical protein
MEMDVKMGYCWILNSGHQARFSQRQKRYCQLKGLQILSFHNQGVKTGRIIYCFIQFWAATTVVCVIEYKSFQPVDPSNGLDGLTIMFRGSWQGPDLWVMHVSYPTTTTTETTEAESSHLIYEWCALVTRLQRLLRQLKLRLLINSTMGWPMTNTY